MKNKKLKLNSVIFLLSLLAIGGSVGIVAIAQQKNSNETLADKNSTILQNQTGTTSDDALALTGTGQTLGLQARQLRSRLVKGGTMIVPPLAILQNALRERQETLKEKVIVREH